MNEFDDYYDAMDEERIEQRVIEQVLYMSEAPVIEYLAHHGDAIEERVRACLLEARALTAAGFHGAALVRAASAIEITIRFFLLRALVQGAFLSSEWSQLLSQRVFNARTAEDRDLLPAVLRKWGIHVTAIKLRNGKQLWETVVNQVWRSRNDYVHKGASIGAEVAALAIESLDVLIEDVVSSVAQRLKFTRKETGCWSIVTDDPPNAPGFNPPHVYERLDPFKD